MKAVLLLLSLTWLVAPSLSGKITCDVCKKFVDSFDKRLEDTANSNYAGGDTNWEEEKLGSYANSEVRLIEMLDSVCKHSDYECHRLLEDHEESIEIWWFKLRHEEGSRDLGHWLCFQTIDVCCPPNTFGTACDDCPGGRETPCSGRGTCQGAEEKDGKGDCKCDTGYAGITCESCDPSYYNDTETGECKRCDKSCKEGCSDEGPDSCGECASGYQDKEGVCSDIDECRESEELCEEGTYCLNTPGNHRCQACDKACTVCNGHGPSKCGGCSSGYQRNEGGVCTDVNECEATEDLCSTGTYCQNSEGSYSCNACHVACQLTCSGAGPEECDECKSGYRMEDSVCVDIDECTNTPGPCDPAQEKCVNLPGSFSCRCNDDLIRSPQTGDCVKPVKKNKKKKKTKNDKESSGDDDGIVRVQYSWFHLTGPLLLLWVTTQYCNPNMATSLAIIFIGLWAWWFYKDDYLAEF